MFRKRPRDKDDPARDKPDDKAKALARRDDGAAPPEKKHLDAVLEVLGGPDKGKAIPLTRIVTLIGRDEKCDVVLPDATVSREHGQIEQSVNEWIYTNFSENGTWINRKRADRAVLTSGDTIEAGSQTRLRFVLKEPELAPVAPVVRRRVRRSREDIQADDERDDQTSTLSIGETLLKRRKLLIGISVYLVGIIAIFVALSLSGGTGSQSSRIPEFEKEKLRIWLNTLTFKRKPDMTMAGTRLREAEQYAQRYPFGDEMDLFNAIRAFQEAAEYGGSPRLREFRYQKMFTETKQRLLDDLWALYRNALIAEAQGNTYQTRQLYNRILKRLPEYCPFYEHVQARLNNL